MKRFNLHFFVRWILAIFLGFIVGSAVLVKNAQAVSNDFLCRQLFNSDYIPEYNRFVANLRRSLPPLYRLNAFREESIVGLRVIATVVPARALHEGNVSVFENFLRESLFADVTLDNVYMGRILSHDAHSVELITAGNHLISLRADEHLDPSLIYIQPLEPVHPDALLEPRQKWKAWQALKGFIEERARILRRTR